MISRLFTAWILIGGLLMDGRGIDNGSCRGEDAASDVAKTGRPDWTIVIHGGAGGDPAKWDQAKIQARKDGLRRALQTGRDLLSADGSAMDTVEAVIRLLEDDAAFNAGRGAVLTEDGRIELDASIMDGATGGCGAVASVTTVKNPISLARLVMAHTPHVLLVGPGAEEFARSQQVPLVDPDYFLSTWGDGDSSQLGTVGCVARDKRGNLAAGTSTGGTAKKLPGRVGDSPIVGAGTYAANDSCAVSGTGIGEEFIRHAVAHDIAAQMRYAGRTLESAVWTVIGERLPAGIGGVIAVSHLGEIVMQHNTPGLSCGAADSSGRFEIHLALDRGGAPAAGPVSAEHQIQSLLEQQARDWNDGKLDAFMSVYWNSDQLTFSSGGTITRGFDATLARYRQRYPTAEAMGRVGFSELEFLPLGGDAIQVLGRWQLSRAEDAIAGRFTLVWQRFASGWKIVHDHTSLDDK